MKFYILVELEEYDTVSEHYAICISFRYDCRGTLCILSADRQLLFILFPQICSHFFFTFQNRFFKVTRPENGRIDSKTAISWLM